MSNTSPKPKEETLDIDSLKRWAEGKGSAGPKLKYEPPSESNQQVKTELQSFDDNELAFNQPPSVLESRRQSAAKGSHRFSDSKYRFELLQAINTREFDDPEPLTLPQLYIFAVSYAMYNHLRSTLVESGIKLRAAPGLCDRLGILFQIFCIQSNCRWTGKSDYERDRTLNFLYLNHRQA